MGAAEEAAGVAVLLKEWKDRSGYSYGVLAKRLHMSTSTLHRYCNGDAVPTEYAPLERLARLCRATPDELVELHRRWILADEARRRERDRRQGGGEAGAPVGAKGERVAGSGLVTAAGATSVPRSTSAPEPEAGGAAAARGTGAGHGSQSAESAVESGATSGSDTGIGVNSRPEVEDAAHSRLRAGSGTDAHSRSHAASDTEAEAGRDNGPPMSSAKAATTSVSTTAAGPATASASDADAGEVAEVTPEGRPVRRRPPAGSWRRIALTAGIAVAAVAASAALVAGLVSDGGDRKAASGAAATRTHDDGKPTQPGDGRSASASAKPHGEGGTSPTPTWSHTPGSRTSGRSDDRATSPDAADRAGLPVSVDVRPYTWEDPCSQRYLVDRKPGEMPPPPPEQDARGWIAALGAVSADSQRVQMSVQGVGGKTVILHALRVRVVGSAAPPAWTAYSMGVGCGGDIKPKSLSVSLDAAQPRITPQNGQPDFPYRTSESDPEVFQVIARAGSRDVRWYMELEWSSGNRHGTLRIDDNGEPFHTSGMAGRPQYDYPLGGSKWIPAPEENG
ncbi:helix-turn-helix domain-containing protein [Streptomyces angustmyceticus]|uniref:transcriptional regulator n=1 Tax=Streptomyces angustmyceticus TaxID=285578 RepID=UPI00369E20A6